MTDTTHQGAVGAETMTAEAKTVSARTLAGMLRSRIERAADHKSETVSLGQFFADQIHRYLTEAGHGPEHDARIGDVPADGGDPDRDRGRDWGLRARQVHLEALSKRAAGGKWFASTNGADGLARLDNGTDGMFPIRGEWHEIEFVEALVNAYRHGDLATPAPRTDGGMTAGEDHAWTFERTRTYLLSELERLRADLHTIGEDLTGEQGKAASWLDVATGRVANVSSVLASATPAHPAGAVPDSLRALLEDAFNRGFDFAEGNWHEGTEWFTWAKEKRAKEIEDIIVSHPGEQSEAGHERCEICDKPLIAGQRAMQDVELGTVHAACCGPEKEAYVKDVETGEPLGPNDPIPQGYVYEPEHPAGQSAGSGAETDALVDRFSAALKVKLRAAEAKYGWKNGWLKSDWQVECQNGLLRHVGKGDPLDVAAYAAFCWHHGWPSASRRSTDLVTGAVIPTAGAIAAYETRYPDGSLSETSDNTIEAWNRVAAAVCLAEKPAPDSTRTGDEGTDWVLVPAKPTEEMIAAGWIDKEDVDPDDIYRAMIAARPAAPEAQGAWKHSHEEPEIGRRHVRLYEDGSGAVLLVRYDTGLLDAEGCDFEPHSNYPLGLWAYTPNGFRLWAEDHGDNRLTVPAPPASSGQEG